MHFRLFVRIYNVILFSCVSVYTFSKKLYSSFHVTRFKKNLLLIDIYVCNRKDRDTEKTTHFLLIYSLDCSINGVNL